jgi:uncharacterized protein Yka (UPF0111/DUF47 family)
MAVAHDAASNATSNADVASFSWTHTPSGTPRAAIVFVACQNLTLADPTPVSAVTYGGVSMAELPYYAYTTSTERGAVSAWFLDDVPAGAQTVQCTRANNSIVVHAGCATVTADRACEIPSALMRARVGAGSDVTGGIATGSSTSSGWSQMTSIDDGSPGSNSQRYMMVYSGNANLPGAGANTSAADIQQDWGNNCWQCLRDTTPSQGAVTLNIGTAITDDLAVLAFAVREVPTSGNSYYALAGDSVSFMNDYFWSPTNYPQVASDSVTSVSDSLVRSAMAKIRSSADSLPSLTDAVDRVASRVRTASESIASITESVARSAATKIRSVLDAVSVPGSVTVTTLQQGSSFEPYANEIEQITVAATGGTWALWWQDGGPSLIHPSLAWDISGDGLKQIIDTWFDEQWVSVTKVGDIYTVTFDKIGSSSRNFAQMTADGSNLVGSGIAESVVRGSAAKIRSSADSVASAVESVARALGLQRSLSDSLGSISEVAAKALTAARSASESIGSITETAARGVMSVARSISDSASSITESIVSTFYPGVVLIVRSAADAIVSLVESASRSTVMSRITSDLIGSISEQAGVVRAAIRAAVDAIPSISDVATRSMSIGRSATDAVASIVESVMRQFGFSRMAGDAVSLISETADRSLGLARVAADIVVSLVEQVARAPLAAARSAADAISSVLESAVKNSALRASASDVIDVVSEAATRSGVFFRSTFDSIPWVRENWQTIGRAIGSIVRGARSSASIVRSVPSVAISRVGKATSSIIRVRGTSSIERKDKSTGGIERE